MANKESLKAQIIKAMQELVEAFPEMIEMLSDKAFYVLVESELKEWENACLTQGTANVEHIPQGLQDKVNEMLSYTRNKRDVKMVFHDVLTFFKQEPDTPRWWHDRIEPYQGSRPYIYTPGDTEITQEDIDEAIDEWDKQMPDYKGMLDAKVETSEE